MVNLKEIYKCNVCGNVVEVHKAGVGTLVCCSQNMVLQTENTQEAATEKHIPVIKIEGDKVMVIVGEVEHPMEEKHFIEWVQVVTSTKTFMKYLAPKDKPSASFEIPQSDEIKRVRAYCNLHGLWSAELKD